MEHLLLKVSEHKYLQKHKLKLEADYNIKIDLPEVKKNAVFCSSDVIFACIHGEGKNIQIVKNLMKELNVAVKTKKLSAEDKCVAVITLSDSDTNEPPEGQTRTRKKMRKKPSSTATESTNGGQVQVEASSSLQPAEEFIPLPRQGRKRPRSKKWLARRTPKRPRVSQELQAADDSVILLEDDAVVAEASLLEVSANDSVLLLEEVPLVMPEQVGHAAVDVAPTMVVPRPLQMRILRPIVIDGNNVAREHGKGSRTYSCRGIQLAVDFFLQRGHSEVTAFVPNFRRFKVHGPFPTTHPEILEELAMSQRVVFTPSRNLNGKRLTCYDDRFIVELASTTDGVILSNDNYRDLVGESDAFKKTIEERLLLFCFVGDKLMIPQDPLGRNGPTLDTYLSLPPPPPECSSSADTPVRSPTPSIILL